MADIVQQDVLDHASELGTGTPVISDGAWDDVLEYVNQINLCVDINTRMARIYLAAHILTMTRRAASASAGPVVSEASGNVRRTYGFVGSAASTASLTTTRYGQRYWETLLASGAGGPGVI